MIRRPVRLTSAAERDLLEAVAWYRREAPHVVPRFRVSVRETLKRIEDNPYLNAIVHRQARFAIVHGFPYSILFRASKTRSR